MSTESILGHAYAVVLAGGSGTRFWPASRRRRPKHLLTGIFGPGTLLERTVERVRPLIPPERTYVFTNRVLKPAIVRLLTDIPPAQIVAEPAARNTAPTLGLAAHEIACRDPQGLMVVLPSDHLIARPAVLRRGLRAALHWASQGERSVLIGLEPRSAHTGYGYIQRAGLAAQVGGQMVYRVASFTEKPSSTAARKYVASGRYFWNGGMFVWRASTLLANLGRFKPELARGLMRIAEAGGAGATRTLERIYPRLEKISIDYAVAENADEVYVIASDPGWSDVGSWSEVYAMSGKDSAGNARPRRSCCFEAQGNLIVGQKFVAAVGVQNLVIIETPDAILVADRRRAQQVGRAVAEMDRQGWKDLL